MCNGLASANFLSETSIGDLQQLAIACNSEIPQPLDPRLVGKQENRINAKDARSVAREVFGVRYQ
eukprot:2850853-Alexandrium_andersonii.AAC.1